MSKGSKKLVSQRWNEDFADLVKSTSNQLNMTMTDLTIESIEFLLSLIESKPELMKERRSRTQYLQSLLNLDFDPTQVESITLERTKNKREGYVIDRIREFLVQNSQQTFSTVELAEVLDIPQPTVRTYIRTIAETNNKFKLFPGRPNFIGYFN